jgi:hypothetical protein
LVPAKCVKIEEIEESKAEENESDDDVDYYAFRM